MNLMKQHTSIRNFKDKKLSEQTKNELITVAQSGSSSNFVQAYSIIDVTDPKIREEIGNISQSAPYVIKSGAFFIFSIDFYRHAQILKKAGLSLAGISNVEALLVGAVDTTIAGQNMALAAESQGLGICYIGGIRNDIIQVADLLHLPKYTVPLFGLTIGYPASKNQLKPRLPRKNISFKNTYDTKMATDLMDYEKITQSYYANRSSNVQKTNWIKKMQDYLSIEHRPDVAGFIKKQGFNL